eukprot:540638_1
MSRDNTKCVLLYLLLLTIEFAVSCTYLKNTYAKVHELASTTKTARALNDNWIKIIGSQSGKCQVQLIHNSSLRAALNESKLINAVQPNNKQYKLYESSILKQEELKSSIINSLTQSEGIELFYSESKSFEVSAYAPWSFNSKTVSIDVAQPRYFQNFVKDNMPNFRRNIEELLHSDNFTQPVFHSFNYTNWMLPQLLYAAETSVRIQLFEWFKRMDDDYAIWKSSAQT